MPNHGGARPGAGRKPGVPNRRSREFAERAAAEGITPLDYMLAVMRDDGVEPAMRMDAAKSAAPYIHAKLSAVEMTGKDGGPIDANLSISILPVSVKADG